MMVQRCGWLDLHKEMMDEKSAAGGEGPLKVAVICPDDISVVLFCKGLIKALLEYEDTSVCVISDVWKGREGIRYTEVIESWGVRHILLPMYRHLSPLKDLQYAYRLFKILAGERIDVAVNVTTKPNIYGTIAAKLAGVKKSLCSVWGRGAVFVDGGSLINAVLKPLVLGLYCMSFRLSDKVWFTNEGDLHYFISRRIVPIDNTILTKNYVSTEDYYPHSLPVKRLEHLKKELRLGDHDSIVIMVGRMIWAKGVREFVEASRILKDRLPHVRFVLVGPAEDGSSDAVPESYLWESEQAGNFSWVGFRDDVKDLYALSDLAVLPSYYREGGYPRGLTEPMAMGKPVIAADCADCRAPVEEGKNGYLVPPKDSRALADAIERLMNDETKRREFGKYSRLKVEREYEEKVIVRQVIREFLER